MEIAAIAVQETPIYQRPATGARRLQGLTHRYRVGLGEQSRDAQWVATSGGEIVLCIEGVVSIRLSGGTLIVETEAPLDVAALEIMAGLAGGQFSPCP